jgi:hypothetical protein
MSAVQEVHCFSCLTTSEVPMLSELVKQLQSAHLLQLLRHSVQEAAGSQLGCCSVVSKSCVHAYGCRARKLAWFMAHAMLAVLWCQ